LQTSSGKSILKRKTSFRFLERTTAAKREWNLKGKLRYTGRCVKARMLMNLALNLFSAGSFSLKLDQ